MSLTADFPQGKKHKKELLGKQPKIADRKE